MAIPNAPSMIRAGKWICRPLLARCPATFGERADVALRLDLRDQDRVDHRGREGHDEAEHVPEEEDLEERVAVGGQDHGREGTAR